MSKLNGHTLDATDLANTFYDYSVMGGRWPDVDESCSDGFARGVLFGWLCDRRETSGMVPDQIFALIDKVFPIYRAML